MVVDSWEELEECCFGVLVQHFLIPDLEDVDDHHWSLIHNHRSTDIVQPPSLILKTSITERCEGRSQVQGGEQEGEMSWRTNSEGDTRLTFEGDEDI